MTVLQNECAKEGVVPELELELRLLYLQSNEVPGRSRAPKAGRSKGTLKERKKAAAVQVTAG